MKTITMMRRGSLWMAAALVLAACGQEDVAYDASGVFETTEVVVSAETSGRMVRMDVEEGTEVKAGQVLGVVDTLQLSLKRRQLVATLSATDSKRLDEGRQVAAVRQQIENWQRERNRFSELLKAGAATQKQVDDIDYQIAVLQRQLSATAEQVGSGNTSLRGQTGSITAQILQIDDQVRRSVITAPIAGVVVSKYMEGGEFAALGKPVVKLADISDMVLRAYVSAGQLTAIRIGQRVTVYADQGTDGRKAYQGRVAWVSDRAEFTPKTIQTRDERANLVYAVKIHVANDGLIKRGMYGDVKF